MMPHQFLALFRYIAVFAVGAILSLYITASLCDRQAGVFKTFTNTYFCKEAGKALVGR